MKQEVEHLGSDYEEECSENEDYELVVMNKPIKNKELIKKILLTLDQHADETEKETIDDILNNFNDNTLENMDSDTNSEIERLISKYRIHVIETIVDSDTRVYNRYTEKNPMKGLSYEEKYKRWKLTTGNRKTSNDIYKIREELLRDLNYQTRNGSAEIFQKYFFEYGNKYFICYEIDNEIWFDINQVISTLDLEERMEQITHKKNKNAIMEHLIHENIYKGYWIRELIEEKTLYKIMLNSNSPISVKFKENAGEIIMELRKANGLIIENGSIKIKPDIKKCLEFSEINKPYICNDIEHMKDMKREIKESSNIIVSAFIGKPIMYLFLIASSLREKTPVIKIGYSDNIDERKKVLSSNYKSELYLLRIKRVTSQSDEKRFHKHLKINFPNLKKQHNSEQELYFYHPTILLAFDNYMPTSTDIVTTDTTLTPINGNNTLLTEKLINIYEDMINMSKHKMHEQNKEINYLNNEIESLKDELREKNEEIDRLSLKLANLSMISENNTSNKKTVNINNIKKVDKLTQVIMKPRHIKKHQEGYYETYL